MRAVALHLEGPLQSWGGPTAGDDRPTWNIPSKSGVLGLVAASLGIDRGDEPALVALHRAYLLGVRVDAEGVHGLDFHTAQDVPSGERKPKSVVSRRAYLQDAAFTVLLVESEEGAGNLEGVLAALRYPAYVQYLGRRACVPSRPICASNSVIEGADWAALFAQVARAKDNSTGTAIFVEGRFSDEITLRRMKFRDERVGPIARLFQERSVTQVRPVSAQGVKDTVTTWFPT